MTLQTEGPISLDDIVAEFRPGYSGASNLEQFYRNGDYVISGTEGAVDKQTFYGSGTVSNTPNSGADRNQVYRLSVNSGFDTNPISVNASTAFNAPVSNQSVGSTNVSVSTTTRTASGSGSTSTGDFNVTGSDGSTAATVRVSATGSSTFTFGTNFACSVTTSQGGSGSFTLPILSYSISGNSGAGSYSGAGSDFITARNSLVSSLGSYGSVTHSTSAFSSTGTFSQYNRFVSNTSRDRGDINDDKGTWAFYAGGIQDSGSIFDGRGLTAEEIPSYTILAVSDDVNSGTRLDSWLQVGNTVQFTFGGIDAIYIVNSLAETGGDTAGFRLTLVQNNNPGGTVPSSGAMQIVEVQATVTINLTLSTLPSGTSMTFTGGSSQPTPAPAASADSDAVVRILSIGSNWGNSGITLSTNLGASTASVGTDIALSSSWSLSHTVARYQWTATNNESYTVTVDGISIASNNTSELADFASGSRTVSVTTNIALNTLPTFSLNLDTGNTGVFSSVVSGTFLANQTASQNLGQIRTAILNTYPGLSDTIGSVMLNSNQYVLDIDTEQMGTLNASFDIVANDATNAMGSINSSFVTGNVMVPGSSYAIFDYETREIHSFTHNPTGGVPNNIGYILSEFETAVDNNTETPIDFTAQVSNTNLVLTASVEGRVENPWTIVVDHGTGGTGNIQFGSFSGDTSGNAERTEEGTTEQILNANVPEIGDVNNPNPISLTNFYGASRI